MGDILRYRRMEEFFGGPTTVTRIDWMRCCISIDDLTVTGLVTALIERTNMAGVVCAIAGDVTLLSLLKGCIDAFDPIQTVRQLGSDHRS